MRVHRGALPDLVRTLVHAAQNIGRGISSGEGDRWTAAPSPIAKVDGRLLLCALADLPHALPAPLPDTHTIQGDVAYLLITSPPSDLDAAPVPSPVTPPPQSTADPARKSPTPDHPPHVLALPLAPGKRAQYAFQHRVLPRSTAFIVAHLARGRRVCVACASGRDIGPGVVLAALQRCFDDAGHCVAGGASESVPAGAWSAPPRVCVYPRACAEARRPASKRSVRTRLEWVVASRPAANPSRTTLKRVNDYLLSGAFVQRPNDTTSTPHVGVGIDSNDGDD